MNMLDPNIPLMAQVPQANWGQQFAQGVATSNNLLMAQQSYRNLQANKAYGNALMQATGADGQVDQDKLRGLFAASGYGNPETMGSMASTNGQMLNNQGVSMDLASKLAANGAVQANPGSLIDQYHNLAGSGYGATGAPYLNQESQGNLSTQQNQLNLNQDRLNVVRNLAGPLAMSKNITPDQVDAFIDMLGVHGILPSEEVDNYKNEVASIGPNPNQLHQWLSQVYGSTGAAQLGQELPHTQILNDGMEFRNVVTDPLTGSLTGEQNIAPNKALVGTLDGKGNTVLTPTNQASGRQVANPIVQGGAQGIGAENANAVHAANNTITESPRTFSAIDGAYDAISKLPSTGRFGHVTPQMQNALNSIPGLSKALGVGENAAINYEEGKKFLMQYQISSLKQMGVGGTDYQLATEAAAFPQMENNQEALKALLRYQRGAQQFQLERAKYVQQQAANDPGSASGSATDFSNKVGITPFLLRNMTPSEVEQYKKRLSPSQQKQIVQQMQNWQIMGSK